MRKGSCPYRKLAEKQKSINLSPKAGSNWMQKAKLGRNKMTDMAQRSSANLTSRLGQRGGGGGVGSLGGGIRHLALKSERKRNVVSKGETAHQRDSQIQ